MNLVELFRSEENIVTIPKGQTVFAEGDLGDAMFVLLDGSVEISVHGLKLEEAGPGTIMGEMSLIDNSPRAATVVAMSDCKLAIIEINGFKFLIRESPDFAICVMQVMAYRLRNTDKFLRD